jgi:acyl-CoA synthetase (NDP forming)
LIREKTRFNKMQTQDQSRRILLNEIESKRLLHEAGIPVIPTRLARTQKEAVAFIRWL